VNPVELLQRLIRFDTTNPPGNEAECVGWLDSILREAGIETRIVAKDDARPNLIARLPGRGDAAPLLLQGHVDVVPTAGQDWRVPPFEGRLEDGYVWGRGALDMKGGVAMMASALMRAAREESDLSGDVILAAMSDEEAGSDCGAKFLVEEHPDLFEGVRYALGEFGGFTREVAGRRLYPIMVAEKQVCWTAATVRGPGGHAALPHRGGAMARLGRLLTQLDRKRLPVHVTPPARLMIEGIVAELPAPLGLPLRGLLEPQLTDRLLDTLGERLRPFDPVLHNTANATIVRGGDKINVLPSELIVELDCRLLPGFGPDDVHAELRDLAAGGVTPFGRTPRSDDAIEFETSRFDPTPAEPDMGLFDTLGGVLRDLDPEARPVPYLMPAITDARFFARLGIQTYGFLPLQLPDELGFMDLIHAADERVPAKAIEFGAEAMHRALQRFG
jgi:acetylornithine deacetylase/succinyl-diaminopimelate desuccinylase-like protein